MYYPNILIPAIVPSLTSLSVHQRDSLTEKVCAQLSHATRLNALDLRAVSVTHPELLFKALSKSLRNLELRLSLPIVLDTDSASNCPIPPALTRLLITPTIVQDHRWYYHFPESLAQLELDFCETSKLSCVLPTFLPPNLLQLKVQPKPEHMHPPILDAFLRILPSSLMLLHLHPSHAHQVLPNPLLEPRLLLLFPPSLTKLCLDTTPSANGCQIPAHLKRMKDFDNRRPHSL